MAVKSLQSLKLPNKFLATSYLSPSLPPLLEGFRNCSNFVAWNVRGEVFSPEPLKDFLWPLASYSFRLHPPHPPGRLVSGAGWFPVFLEFHCMCVCVCEWPRAFEPKLRPRPRVSKISLPVFLDVQGNWEKGKLAFGFSEQGGRTATLIQR